MTTESKKKNPDYQNSAINLCNPPEVKEKLDKLAAVKKEMAEIEGLLQQLSLYQGYQALQDLLTDLMGNIRFTIEQFGSYQDVENGIYGLIYESKSPVYDVQKARFNLPEDKARLVIVETVDSKALNGLLKGGLITQEQADNCILKYNTRQTPVIRTGE